MSSSAMRPQDPVHARAVTSARQAPLSASPSSAATPSSLGRSDIISPSDFSNPTLVFQKQRFPLSVIPLPRSSSLAVLMGQGQARPDAPPLPEATASLTSKGITLGTAAVATGHKFKRALGVRRRQSDNIPVISNSPGKEQTATKLHDNEPPSRSPLNARFLASQLHAFGSKKFAKRPSSPLPLPLPSPNLAPTPDVSLSSRLGEASSNQQSSIVPLSPSISSASDYNRKTEDEVNQVNDEQISELRDERRKSDSTMTAKLGTPRSSRPVSMAGSVQSTHTIVPNALRLSSLITDTSFGMAEESDPQPEQVLLPSTSTCPSPRHASLSNSKIRNRYSVSLVRTPSLPSPSSPTAPSHLDVEPTPPTAIFSLETFTKASTLATNGSTFLHTSSTGFIPPSNLNSHSTGRNIRGRLAAWTATNNVASFPRQSQALPTSGIDPLSSRRSVLSPSHRQTKTSLTGSLAPAAGLAKRAVEKMGRALGGFASSSSSGYSSTSTTSSPTSQSSSFTSEHVLSRYDSQRSAAVATEKKSRKPPHVSSSSMASSVVSSTDLDAFLTPDGPYLGQQLRLPLRRANNGASVAGGLVFGRDLRTCCRETAVKVGRSVESVDAQDRVMGASLSSEQEGLNVLESRVVPAIVVRCAQHLLLWGVHEEGLFRVNGRPFHVSKLRSEFDTGADYDMSQCGPGDLDPHAVASVFKAYLRELPEPILTRSLLSQFEAAITTESITADRNPKGSSILGRGIKGPSLPAGPRSGLRKPPSLSTLALPNFSTSKPPSRTLVKTLRSLITQLPDENRDLIRTVAELIKTTAQCSKQTKMPLSNLLLVFCPSLNMNPPLLRVLCECDGIWEDLPNTPLDADDAMTDLRTPRPSSTTDTVTSKAISGRQRTFDTDAIQDSANEALPISEISTLRARPLERIGPIPTVYLDAESCGSSLRPLGDSDSMSSKDDVSYVSTSEEPVKDFFPPSTNKAHSDLRPPLLPSADSVATSTSSLSFLPIPTNLFSKSWSASAPGSPTIVESTRKSFPPGKPAISSPITSPVQLPFKGPIPHPPNPVTRRRSDPTLSPPTFSFQSEDRASNPSSSDRAKRLKKPSLNLLFVKPMTAVPSATSLISFSPYLHGWSRSDTSSSTPTSAFTAQTSQSVTNLAPVLDTQIDSSPLGLVLSGGDDERQDPGKLEEPLISRDSVVSLSGAHGSTFIADKYLIPSVSTQSFHDASEAALPPLQRISPSRPDVSSGRATSSNNRLGELVKTDSGDWTRSVLIAAEIDSRWLPQHGDGNPGATPVPII